MLQDSLEEKDKEIERLNYELQQKGSREDGKTDAASEKKDGGEKISDEALDWHKP